MIDTITYYVVGILAFFTIGLGIAFLANGTSTLISLTGIVPFDEMLVETQVDILGLKILKLFKEVNKNESN